MAEELKQEEGKEPITPPEGEKQVEEIQEKVVAEPTEIELKAMRMGWKPKDEFSDPDDYVDAEEFVKRKPLFDKNAQLKNELKDVKKALRELANFQLQIRENERKSTLEELRIKKHKALTDGDADALIVVDEQIADVRAEEIAQKNTPPVKQAPHPHFIAWVEKNTWYAQDAELRAEADFLGTRYAASNPDKDPEEVLVYVASKIKRMYPDKFQNPNRSKPSSVEGTSNAKASSKKEDEYPLTEEERRVMKTFVRQNVMTEAEYIKELRKVKGEA